MPSTRTDQAFIDSVRVRVKAGNGGNGCISFRREKFVPRGGPDGGDGGRGGNVVFVGETNETTLIELHAQPFYRAGHAGPGTGAKCHGADGLDLECKVPLGTVVTREADGLLIGEVLEQGQRLIVAKGGKGGLGNVHFRSSQRQAPRICTPGEPGEELDLRVELKILAQVALVGLPNAGKSTLLNAICRTRAKVADYPFTTLHPVLGTLYRMTGERLLIADIPGLIEGASEGLGLGIDFLKHIERTQLLLYVLDAGPEASPDAVEALDTLTNEIAQYSEAIAKRPRIIALNKIDLTPKGHVTKKLVTAIERRCKKAGGPYRIVEISGKNAIGTEALVDRLAEMLKETAPKTMEPPIWRPSETDPSPQSEEGEQTT